MFSIIKKNQTIILLRWTFLEKQLRDAAAAEVAQQNVLYTSEENEKGSRKRKSMNADEKAKQK